jgi:hypothetical protein
MGGQCDMKQFDSNLCPIIENCIISTDIEIQIVFIVDKTKYNNDKKCIYKDIANYRNISNRKICCVINCCCD